MDKEISMSVEIGIGLTALAAVLTLIIFTVLLGKGIMADATNSLNDTTQVVSSNYVEDLYHGSIPEIIPAATAYTILTNYSNFIVYEVNTYDSTIRKLDEDPSVLRTNLRGRVSFKLGKLINGTYYVTIRPVNSDEEYQDTTQAGLNAFNVQYRDLIDNTN